MLPRTLAGPVVLALLALSPVATAAPPPEIETVTITPTSGPQTYEGNSATGSNVEYNFDTGEPCIEDQASPEAYCDQTLLHVDLSADPDFWATNGGGVQVAIGDYSGVSGSSSDFDLQIWNSDADGNKGTELVGSSAAPPGNEEQTTITEPDGYYLVQVIYFAVVQSSYTMTVGFATRFEIPPDVDLPPGLQEALASDPSDGWRSRSEMHMAQSPIDPNILIAGSKFYNKDLHDSLGEYEFKVGTYVSFDGGQTWTDLGQTAVCPASESPPESWADSSHTCYPAEDPNRDGLDEDEQGPVQHAEDGDYGEEYITSDPWVQFDDEGNAYLMVLDHPPFDLDPEGNGWGMTLHRWDSVSPADVSTGDTWGPRLPISAYEDDLNRQLFLDDKNTFALNNAGEDGDGTTGTMISCWGQNIPPIIKQQVVCNRSTNQGDSWSEPVPISGVHQLVIGPHVIPHPANASTFYAVWLQYASEIATGEATLEFNRTTDGGQTWLAQSIPITTMTGIPRSFPGQAFRNLSIPIMSAGPVPEGGGNPPLYLAIAQYLAAPDPATDQDGMQADIIIYRSTNGGTSWSELTNLTEDTGAGTNLNADQFQPYIDVVREGESAGQINVTYFDRRHDLAVTGHPGNYFTDVYLSRSNDGGETFTDVRLTHDMTDPQYNAPVSPSGLFFGDYQGLTVTECAAFPFVNDTHLANDEFIDPDPDRRDPDFDPTYPQDPHRASPYQEAIGWRVPNTAEFGGTSAALPETCALPKPFKPPLPEDAARCPRNLKGNLIIGSHDRDILVGTNGRDILCGGRKNDTLRGLGGNDLLIAGNGKDILRGGKGNDKMRGGPGNDILAGGAGKDLLRGGGGRDTLRGGAKKDRCIGGGGKDRVRAC